MDRHRPLAGTGQHGSRFRLRPSFHGLRQRLYGAGQGATYYPGDGSSQSVYSIHKSATIGILNAHFRPYQNEIYPEESTIVELVPEGYYQATAYDDTQENLSDISDGNTEDGAQ